MGRSIHALLGVALPLFVVAMAAVACGGGGETDGLNEPGGDTELDPDWGLEHALGSIAVELDESNAWVVNVGQRYLYDEYEDAYVLQERRGSLVALTTHGTSLTATNVLDVSGGSDRRISFPVEGRAIYFEQVGFHTERIVRLDTTALAPTLERTVSGHFTGARTSPSRELIVANDQLDSGWRVALVHTSSLETAILPQDGFMPQGVWNRTSDRLWTVTMGLDPMWASVKRIRVDGIGEYETEVDVFLDGWGCDPKFDYSWVAVSPDDRWAVFPLWQGQDRRLTVIDQLDGSVRTIPGSGPVGFTPDGGAIVSYGATSGESVLYLTDPLTLDSELVSLADLVVPQYYTAPNGSWIVIAPAYGSIPGQLVVYDWATGESTSISTPASITLDEFVMRPSVPELWIVSQGELYRLDLAAAELETVETPGFAARHVNVLPSRDAIVITEPAGGRVRIFGMSSRTTEASLLLPDPLETTFSPDSAESRGE